MRARAAAPLRLFARCGDEEERTEMSVLTQSPPRPADAALGTVRGQDTLPRLFRQVVRERGERVAMREKHLGIWRAITWREYGEPLPPVQRKIPESPPAGDGLPRLQHEQVFAAHEGIRRASHRGFPCRRIRRA